MKAFENYHTKIYVQVHSYRGTIDTLILVHIVRGDPARAVELFKQVQRRYEGRPLFEWEQELVSTETRSLARRLVWKGLALCAMATVLATLSAMSGQWWGWAVSGILFFMAAWGVITGLRYRARPYNDQEHA